MNGASSHGHAAQLNLRQQAPDLDKATAQAEALKEQLLVLDAKKDRLLKSRPSGAKRNMHEVEALIRAKQHEMERSTLTIKEEKARLQEMKRMKDDAKKAMEWENEFDDIKNKRAQIAESLRAVFADIGTVRDEQSRQDTAAELEVPVEDVVEARTPVSEGLRELLSSARWKKKLRTECAVIVRATKNSVKISGLSDAVEAASRVIAEIGPVVVRRIGIDDAQVALLIGRKGATIEQLQGDSGCSIEVRRKEKQVVLVGDEAAVASLAAQINELFTTQRRVDATIKFDPEQKGTLLGKGGATIQRIQSESGGAMLEIGKGSDPTVRISGPYVAVEAARTEICRLLKLDAESVRSVDVPEEVTGALFGRGEKLRALAAAHGVNIDRTEGGAKVRGSRKAVEAAVSELLAVVEANRRVEEHLEIESYHVGMMLGKGGATVQSIQRETGTTIAVANKPADGKTTQTLTVRGTKAAVDNAMAALEAVLQYKAEAAEVVSVDAGLMFLFLGNGGEELNRIRAETGAAIDVPRDQQKLEFRIRGTVAAVEAAKQAIARALDANKRCAESITLPWHCIDLLLGPNADRLRELEAKHQVQIELPGANLPSDTVCSGSFLAIATSMSIRGRRKHVEAAMQELSALSRSHQCDELELSLDDSTLLAQLCLHDDGLLTRLEAEFGVTLDFEPMRDRVTLRGEGCISARMALQALLAQERPQEVAIACPGPQMELLLASDGQILAQLAQLVAPAMLAVQEFPPAIMVTGSAAIVAEARTKCGTWLEEHADSSQQVGIPPEVQPALASRMRPLAAEYRVSLEMVDGGTALLITGPSAMVMPALAEVRALIEEHATEEVAIELEDPELTLAHLHARSMRAAHAGVTIDVLREEGRLVLMGRRRRVAVVRDELQTLLDEAGGCAHTQPITGAQLERLVRPQSRQEEQPLYRKLQDSTQCALHLDRVALTLTVFGRHVAVSRALKSLETALDVGEESRQVPLSVIPIIIGRGGSTIKRLQQDSGATFDINRNTGSVRVYGKQEAVSTAVRLLDGLLAEQGGVHERPILARQVPLIIGRGGSTIKSLQAESGATIVVSKEENCVRIRGPRHAVDKAVELLANLLDGGPRGAAPTAGAAGSEPPPGCGSAPPSMPVSGL